MKTSQESAAISNKRKAFHCLVVVKREWWLSERERFCKNIKELCGYGTQAYTMKHIITKSDNCTRSHTFRL